MPHMLYSKESMNEEIEEVEVSYGINSLLEEEVYDNIDSMGPPHLYAVSYPYNSAMNKSKMHPPIEISKYIPNLFEDIQEIEIEEIIYAS